MISLCMIVKDEIDSFTHCLLTNRFLDYIDEIIVCTDNQKIKDHCSQFMMADSHAQIKVYDYRWKDDFADARNFSFSKASNDIIFWIDADDVVVHPEKLPELALLIAEGKCDWISLRYDYEKDEHGRIRAQQWKPRLMRKGSGKWEKSVHEVFAASEPVTIVKDQDVYIDHQAKDSAARSAERNLRILMNEYLKDGEQTDPRTIYNIGMTLLTMGRFEEAVPFYSKHIKVCGWPEEKYFSMHYLNECLFNLGRIDEAINISLESTKIRPDWSLAYFDLARAYSYKNQWQKIVEWTLVGMQKQRPTAEEYFTNETDYTVFPLLRLGEAYLQLHKFGEALSIGQKLYKAWPDDPIIKDFYQACLKVMEDEDFVESFTTVAARIGDVDRIKAAKLFESLPPNLDEDARIQAARFAIIPPKVWDAKSIVIYCGKSQEMTQWAQPSIYMGIGGAEEAVIYISEELTKLGYSITVYNDCGDLRGTYKGITYLPFYQFNVLDSFSTLISWRSPGLYDLDIKAKRKYLWLHDIAYPQFFNKKIIDQVNKILFLSTWHRNNLPEIPDEKCFITNNGINPDDFKDLPAKEPNTLFWGSSYDRGLLPFIKNIFPQIIEAIPDVKLHVCYGWNNTKKLIDEYPGIYVDLEQLYTELSPILDNHPNIVHHGRISHKELAKLMGQCVVYPYASEFGETNNITSMKCQASGCYVITTSQAGGTPERVSYGHVVEGNNIYTDPQLQKEFARRVIEYLKESKSLPTNGLIDRLKEEFSWITTAQQWQKELLP